MSAISFAFTFNLFNSIFTFFPGDSYQGNRVAARGGLSSVQGAAVATFGLKSVDQVDQAGLLPSRQSTPNSLADNPHFRFEVSLTAKCGYAKL